MTLEQIAGRTDALPDEVQRLLRQVESSTTHYEALGVAHAAVNDEVELVYQQTLALLLSCQQSLTGMARDLTDYDADATDDPQQRINRAVNRLSHAFSVLSNAKKRAAYDRFAILRTPSSQSSGEAAPSSKDMALYADNAEADAEDNRRRNHRYKLSISAQVVGHDRKAGEWGEAAETIDVSRTGLNMRLRHKVRHGVILHLTLPLPAKLRACALSEETYGVYALVRRVEPSHKGVRVVGVEFIGQQPPAEYLDKPWAIFQTKRWGGTDRRRKPRQERSGVVWLEYFTESLQCITQEAGRLENVSQGGLRACVKTAPPDFEFARASYPDRGIETYAVIRNRYVGKDGVERLCLKFIDNDELAERTIAGLKGLAEVNGDECHKDDPQPVERPSSESAPKALSRSQKILVADDDQPLRKVLGKILTSAGYEVILVEDGKAAVEMAMAERPDLVITDGLMPKMHGFLVCKAIKELQSPPKVILLTAVYTKMHYKWEAKKKYGADELMTKPFEVAELLNCIAKQLSLSQEVESTVA